MAHFKSTKAGNFVKNLSNEEKQIYAAFIYQRLVFLEADIYQYFLDNPKELTVCHQAAYVKIFGLLKKAYYRAKGVGLSLPWPGEPRLLGLPVSGRIEFCEQKTKKIFLGSFMFLLREINQSHYGKTPAVVAAIKKIKYFHNKGLRDYKKVCHKDLKTIKEIKIVKDKGNTFVIAGGLYC